MTVRVARLAAAGLVAASLVLVGGCSLIPTVQRDTSSPSADAGATDDLLLGLTRYPVAERVPAPTISGTTLGGTPLDLASLRGKVVVLNAWASWCEPCKTELPVLVAEAKAAKAAYASSIAFVGLDVNDTEPGAAARMVDRFGVSYPSIVDDGAKLLARIPGVPPEAIPSTVVIDKKGRVAARVIGEVKPGMLAPLLAELSAESG